MSGMTGPLVVRGSEVTQVQHRRNPRLLMTPLFSNFAAGHLVGSSVAVHPHGEECGEHNHRGAVELFFGLEGSGLVVVDGVQHKIGPDDCIVVPAGARHNLIGVSKVTPWKVLCAFVVAPGHENDQAPWTPTA